METDMKSEMNTHNAKHKANQHANSNWFIFFKKLKLIFICNAFRTKGVPAGIKTKSIKIYLLFVVPNR